MTRTEAKQVFRESLAALSPDHEKLLRSHIRRGTTFLCGTLEKSRYFTQDGCGCVAWCATHRIVPRTKAIKNIHNIPVKSIPGYMEAEKLFRTLSDLSGTRYLDAMTVLCPEDVAKILSEYLEV